MSNRLSMAKINSIETLHQSGHSNREIARLLGVDRGAVNRYVRRLKARQFQKRPNPQTGSEPTGDQESLARCGPASQCRAHQELIESKLEQGLSVTSNRPLEDWGKLIGDVPAATAILDRFLQDAELIQITGRSYRLRGRTADNQESSKAAKPANSQSKSGQTRKPAPTTKPNKNSVKSNN